MPATMMIARYPQVIYRLDRDLHANGNRAALGDILIALEQISVTMLVQGR